MKWTILTSLPESQGEQPGSGNILAKEVHNQSGVLEKEMQKVAPISLTSTKEPETETSNADKTAAARPPNSEEETFFDPVIVYDIEDVFAFNQRL